MRIALKLAYIGTDHHGFQVQANAKTIEGELFRALRELNIINDPHEAKYIAAGRTDRAVHALSQVVAFNTDKPNIAVPSAINSRLQETTIWVWARAEVSPGFDPRRFAKYREYMYIMFGKFDLSVMQEASNLLMGKHDFYNFAKNDIERRTISTIKRINVHEAGEFTVIDIRADHFFWHMVRKIATALKMVGTGERDTSWFEKMLLPSEFGEGLQPAPAYGLIFKNVEYDNMTWKEDSYTKRRISETLDEMFFRHAVMSQLLREFKEGMKMME
ncbi:MAG: tRNA pseudouridine(38-40) synthase TruA [Candidatus Methanoperedens sp.]|nr:tRNA pseudouridine(38-40) synthase TruA [Candidatus Methanoperedens sp.]